MQTQRQVSCKDLGVPLDQLVNEHGELEQGYVLSSPSPLKTLELSWSGGTMLSTKLLEGSKQVRPGQGHMMWAHGEYQSNRPAVLQAHSKAAPPPTFEELRKKLEQLQQAPEPVAEAMVAPPPVAARAPSPARSDDVDSDEQPLHPAELLSGTGGDALESKKAKSKATVKNPKPKQMGKPLKREASSSAVGSPKRYRLWRGQSAADSVDGQTKDSEIKVACKVCGHSCICCDTCHHKHRSAPQAAEKVSQRGGPQQACRRHSSWM